MSLQKPSSFENKKQKKKEMFLKGKNGCGPRKKFSTFRATRLEKQQQKNYKSAN